jgi:transposase InsO family protein
MAWQESSLMSLRLEFVRLARLDGANIRELCRRFAISPKTGYKWLQRFEQEGAAGLTNRSRRPTASPSRTPTTIESDILALRQQHPAWGGRKLRRRLGDLGRTEVPAASTITAILRRHNCLGPRAGVARDPQRFEHDAPNQLWQMDFKGHFPTAVGRCHPLTVLDDHSRYAVGLIACADEQDSTVRSHLVGLFRRYGLPDRLLCDNGPPWGSAGVVDAYTALEVWLLRLGVKVSHGRPCHPQTQGKDERFHRTLVAEVLQGQHFDNLTVCQTRFDAWREVYNAQRPHEALGLGVPASRYSASRRAFPETLPPLEYSPGDTVRTVAANGVIGFRGRPWRVGKAFRGQRVGVRSTTTDGVWAVYFGVQEVASLDLRGQNEKT